MFLSFLGELYGLNIIGRPYLTASFTLCGKYEKTSKTTKLIRPKKKALFSNKLYLKF